MVSVNGLYFQSSTSKIDFADYICAIASFEFVLVIAWFGGQLRINFLSKILKFFSNCPSLITKNYKILLRTLIRN